MNNKALEIKEIATRIYLDRINAFLVENPKSKTLKRIRKLTKQIRESKDNNEVIELAPKVTFSIGIVLEKTTYIKNEQEKAHFTQIHKDLQAIIDVQKEESPSS